MRPFVLCIGTVVEPVYSVGPLSHEIVQDASPISRSLFVALSNQTGDDGVHRRHRLIAGIAWVCRAVIRHLPNAHVRVSLENRPCCIEGSHCVHARLAADASLIGMASVLRKPGRGTVGVREPRRISRGLPAESGMVTCESPVMPCGASMLMGSG